MAVPSCFQAVVTGTYFTPLEQTRLPNICTKSSLRFACRLHATGPSRQPRATKAPLTTLLSTRSSRSRTHCSARASLKRGDTIAVVGATGGVGRLLVEQLLSDGRFHVRAVVRSVSSARAVLGTPTAEDSPRLEFAEGNVAHTSRGTRPIPSDNALRAALRGAAAVVIATGTTAMPTLAWGPGLRNGPDAVDRAGTEAIARCLDEATVRRVVLLSSIGTRRTDAMPFAFLNLFGVLDCKRAGEEAVASAARKGGFSYAVVRPGRLVGGPYTNVGEYRKPEQPSSDLAIRALPGDQLLGDISRKCAAHVLVHTLDWRGDDDVEFSIVNCHGALPSKEDWHSQLDVLASSYVQTKPGLSAST